LSSHLPATEVKDRFLGPILAMGVQELLVEVATRVSQHPCWTHSYRDYDRWPNNEISWVVRALLFTEYQDCPESLLFANGDWSDLPLIMPIIEKVVGDLGNNYLVLAEFLTLCERASHEFPSDFFVRIILANLDAISIPLSGPDPQRIASLTQIFSERDKPLDIELQREMLSILGALVDFGTEEVLLCNQASFSEKPISGDRNLTIPAIF
jgi:hypothetical protein